MRRAHSTKVAAGADAVGMAVVEVVAGVEAKAVMVVEAAGAEATAVAVVVDAVDMGAEDATGRLSSS